VLLHKLREAMAEEMKGRVFGGEGKEAEVDGGYFGGYVKPANLREDRIDRRFARKRDEAVSVSGLFQPPAGRAAFIGPKERPQLSGASWGRVGLEMCRWG
jgi:hypothetical protein